MFVLMEAVGAVLAVLTIRALRPQTTTDTPGPTAVPADREPR
jgi:hypothetical protein